MRLPLYQVDAFADQVFGGNPAAVVVMKKWPERTVMQAIAMENNLSETAFVVPRAGRFEIRWFTPTTEVDLCGHATLAAAYVLIRYNYFAGSPVKFAARSGPLRVTHDHDGELFTLHFPAKIARACKPPSELLDAVSFTPSHVAATGKHYLVVFDDPHIVRSLSPDMALLASLPKPGVIVTARGDEPGIDFISRFFAPGHGIPEDPVTGSAHCALAPYWAQVLGKTRLEALQVSARGGRISCEVAGDKVLMTGKVVPYLSGEIEV